MEAWGDAFIYIGVIIAFKALMALAYLILKWLTPVNYKPTEEELRLWESQREYQRRWWM